MLSVRNSSSSTSAPTTVACNLLPCRIKHTGAVNATTKHWQPTPASESEPATSYLRGRRLRGRDIPLPTGYEGIILQPTDETVLCNSNGEADADAEMQEGKDEGEEEMQEMKLCERLARFDKITVWGHEEIVDKVEDEIVKGVEEWVVLAAKIHGYDMEEGER